MSGSGSTRKVAYGPLLAVLMLALAVAVAVQAVLGVASGPEQELLTQLKKAERNGLRLHLTPNGNAELVSERVRFDRVTITAEREQPKARAVATLDFTGKLASGTKVSSLGLERVPFTYDDGWKPDAQLAPELVEIVRALEKRRQALEQADRDALKALFPFGQQAADVVVDELSPISRRRYQALAWYIRNEREQVVVTEEYRLTGALPDRPVDVREHTSLTLDRGPTGYFFSGTLR